jgi:hypothetical protein
MSLMTESLTTCIVLALANTLDLELDHRGIKTASFSGPLHEKKRALLLKLGQESD